MARLGGRPIILSAAGVNAEAMRGRGTRQLQVRIQGNKGIYFFELLSEESLYRRGKEKAKFVKIKANRSLCVTAQEKRKRLFILHHRRGTQGGRCLRKKKY